MNGAPAWYAARPGTVSRRFVPVLLFLLALLLYGRGLSIPYFADDFQFVFDEPSADVFHYFAHKNPQHLFYRPIQSAFLSLVQFFFGLNTLPVSLVTLAAHVLLCWLVFSAVTRLGFSEIQAAAGAGLMLLSQANVHAVLSNDTLSQVAGTLFGCLGLWWLHRSLQVSHARSEPARPLRSRWYAGSVLAFALSLLSKESSAAFLPMLGLLLIAHGVYRSYRSAARLPVQRATATTTIRHYLSDRQALLQAVVCMIPFCTVAVLYFVVRSQIVAAQPGLGTGLYEFRIGTNVLVHIAQFTFAALTPFSSVGAYTALHTAPLLLALIVLATLGVFGLILYGLLQSRRSGLIGLLALFALIGFFPMALLNHVSELYVYNSMPFISALFGIGLGALYRQMSPHPFSKALLTGALALVALGNVLAVEHKTMLMRGSGERASSLLAQILPYARHVPPGGKLVLLNPPPARIPYSVFVMNGFDVLHFGQAHIKRQARREDITVEVASWQDQDPASISEDAVVLTLENNRVVPVNLP